MDSRQMMNEQLRKEFRGREEVESNYVPKFPESVERDYIRLMNDICQEALKGSLQDHLNELIQILAEAEKDAPGGYQKSADRLDALGKQARKNEEKRTLQRWRDLDNTIIRMRRVFRSMRRQAGEIMNYWQINRKLNAIADANRKLTVKEWKKAIGKTLGINILEDYYDGSFYGEMLEKWIAENVGLIKTIPSEALDAMEKKVLEDYIAGKPVSTITKDILQEYRMSKSHARLIARDQIGKLNCQITRHQQQSCGVSKYKWRTTGDQRVRPYHRKLDKKIFDWDHPPVVDASGRRCHPGQDYQCRCVAIPVFDLRELDVAVDGSTRQKQKQR